CTKYGDPPRKSTFSPAAFNAVVDLCANLPKALTQKLPLTGKLLKFKDNTGEQRGACLISKKITKQLPLLVWLHPSLIPQNLIVLTGLLEATTTADLTNDKNRLGYHLLIVSGRNTPHFYPAPDKGGIGWDNWYRNYNRSDPKINVDAQAIDRFIKTAKSVATVDLKRVYMSGWSNGAAMAVQYGLNTPNIAAVAAYAAPDPYRDIHDPCAQKPYPPYLTPFLILYNQCDVFGICTTGQAFISDLLHRYPKLIAKFLVTDVLQLFLVNPPVCIDSSLLCG
ncbi:unnamed protein product, partial [Didymodactylos carnosus]